MPGPTVLKEVNRTVRSCIAGNKTKQAGKLITMGLQTVWSVKGTIKKMHARIYLQDGAVPNVENTGCHSVSRRNRPSGKEQTVKEISDGFLKLRREIK